ncbi:MAG: UDP-N-acetylmuramoyl-L-alanine--D-glutamate ligase [Candidatus Omnitrophota bacterium]
MTIMVENEIRSRLTRPAPRLAGLCALVVGMGDSGQWATELLLREGAKVLAHDNDRAKQAALRRQWEPRGVRFHFDALKPMHGVDFCVISPGVPPFGAFYSWLKQADIPLLGEMELACRFLNRPILAVTGTNGKTTVTNMIEHILNRCGYRAEAAGNVGRPVAQVAVEGVRECGDPLVLEVSSFQCETFEQFRAQAAVITNLAPDHLDRYASLRQYYETKFRIAMNQAPDGALWMGPRVEGDCPEWAPSRRRTFAVDVLGPDGVFYSNGEAILRDGSKEERQSWPSFAKQLPQHVLNALAAAGMAVSFGAPLLEALRALDSFQPLPHRLEFAGEVKGIRCYDDSKATNVHAVEAALRSLPPPIRLIAGGRAKGDSLDPLLSLIREKVIAVYLIGEAAEAFARAWETITQVHLEKTLEEAVHHALRDGRPGESLLLSPACASWDMFKNYAERGERFKQAVKEYKE